MDVIRVSKPNIGKKEINEVIDSLQSGWVTAGPKVHRFENKLKEYLGAKDVIALMSCTAGFHLILKALDIKKGDEIITPSLTYTSIGDMIVNMGAKPIFVDINPKTLQLDETQLKSKITKKTRAIVPVDYAGLPYEISKIKKVLKGRKDIAIIQDAATSFGASVGKKKVGNIADFTCFSFYATKNITTGEGGAVSTNNVEMGEKIRLLSKLGVNASAWKRHEERASWYFDVVAPGFKYYMTDIQAAIGLHQLDKIDQFVTKRQEIAKFYYEQLSEVRIVKSPYPKFPNSHVWNFYPIIVHEKIDRDEFMTQLEDLGVASSVYYIPLHKHKIFRKYLTNKKDVANTDVYFSKTATLPMHPGLKKSDIKKVVSCIKILERKLL